MIMTSCSLLLVITWCVMTCGAPYNEHNDNHHMKYHENHRSLMQNDDPFNDDFFKDFDKVFESTNDTESFDDIFWNGEPEFVNEVTPKKVHYGKNRNAELILEHKKHMNHEHNKHEDRNHEDKKHEDSEHKNHHHKKNKKNKHHKKERKHNKPDAVAEEEPVVNVAAVVGQNNEQDEILKSFVRQQHSGRDSEPTKTKCSASGAGNLTINSVLIISLIWVSLKSLR